MSKVSSLKSFFSKLAFKKTEGADSVSVLDKTVKKLIYIIIVLIPLWFLPITVNAVEFNKQILMIFLVVITLGLWLVKILSQGEIVWRSNILNIFLGIFLIVCVLATVFSLRPYNSLVGWPNNLDSSLVNILSFLALYILIVNSFRGVKEIFGLLFAFLISSTLVTLIGLLQIWNGFIFPWDFTKTVSFNTIGTVNTFGIFSATLLTLITALLFVMKKGSIKLFLLILGLLNLIILISINFWVLWLVLAVGMAIILLFGLMRLVKLEESITWVALPMAFLAVALIFMIFRPVLPLRPNLPVEVGLSYRGGLDVVKEIIRGKPILGTGPESFVFNYVKHKPEGINQTVFWNIRFSNPPAEIYSVVSDLGILGLLSFLIILVLFVIKAVKNLIKTVEEANILKRFLEVGLFAAWLGLAVGWFLYPQNFTLMFVFWLMFALYLAESSIFKEKTYNLKKSPRILLLVSFAFVVMIVFIVGFLYIGGTRFVAEAKYKNGLDLIQEKGQLDKGIDKVIKSTIINPYEDRTYRVLSQLFLLKMNQDAGMPGIDQQQRINLIQVDAINAINSIVRATQLSPKDISNWLTRGQVYRQVMGFVNGADDWAETSYVEAAKLEPLNPFIFTEQGRIYTTKADLIAAQAQKDKNIQNQMNEYLNTALDNFNKAIEIKPDYAPAHFEIALVFDRQGKLDEAISRMAINRQLLPRDTGAAFQLGVLFYKAQKYDQAKGEFIRAIILDPDFANARYFLGLLYDREGNKEDALDQFERIAQLNPDNEQIKQIIINLKAGLPALGSPELGPPEQPKEVPIEQTPKEERKESQP